MIRCNGWLVLVLLLSPAAVRGDEKDAIQWIEGQGGKVVKQADQPVEGIDLRGTRVGDAGLVKFADATSIKSLNLGKTNVTDAGMKHLAVFKSLEQLDLSDTRVTSAGLKQLAPLKNLQTITLADSQLTGKSLSSLREAKLLHALANAEAADSKRAGKSDDVVQIDLRRCEAGFSGLTELAEFPNLETVLLDDAQITGAALSRLGEAKLLHTLRKAITADGKRATKAEEVGRLDLRGTAATGANLGPSEAVRFNGLSALADLTGLQSLLLDDQQINDVAIAELARVKMLHVLARAQGADEKPAMKTEDIVVLDLRGTRVTDNGLAALDHLKNLTNLRIDDGLLTDSAARGLRAARLLHALPQAKAADGKRATKEEEIHSLDLFGTGITDKGLGDLFEPRTDSNGAKQLTPLKNLSILTLEKAQFSEQATKSLAHLENLQNLALFNVEVPPAALKGLMDVKKLEGLAVYSRKLTDDTIPHLAELANLTQLDLSYTSVTDAGFAQLAAMKNLKSLNLSYTRISGAGLKELAPLGQLQTLTLRHTPIIGANLAELTALTSLREINLHGLPVSDANLKEFAALKNLEAINLTNTPITDLGMKDLARINSLQSIILTNTVISDVGVKELVTVKNLHKLNLAGTKVTDASLKLLDAAKELQFLDLSTTPVSTVAISRLSEALPKCVITHARAAEKAEK